MFTHFLSLLSLIESNSFQSPPHCIGLDAEPSGSMFSLLTNILIIAYSFFPYISFQDQDIRLLTHTGQYILLSGLFGLLKHLTLMPLLSSGNLCLNLVFNLIFSVCLVFSRIVLCLLARYLGVSIYGIPPACTWQSYTYAVYKIM